MQIRIHNMPIIIIFALIVLFLCCRDGNPSYLISISTIKEEFTYSIENYSGSSEDQQSHEPIRIRNNAWNTCTQSRAVGGPGLWPPGPGPPAVGGPDPGSQAVAKSYFQANPHWRPAGHPRWRGGGPPDPRQPAASPGWAARSGIPAIFTEHLHTSYSYRDCTATRFGWNCTGAATQRQITQRKCHKTSMLLNVYVQNVQSQNVYVTKRKPSLNNKRHRM